MLRVNLIVMKLHFVPRYEHERGYKKECFKCKLKYRKLPELYKHLESSHPDPSEKTLYCALCNVYFHTAIQLLNHKKWNKVHERLKEKQAGGKESGDNRGSGKINGNFV